MSADKSPAASHGDELIVPFLFVPEGQSPPEDWRQAHPGAIRIPATLVLRRDGSIAGIKLARNEGNTTAVPATPGSFAPVPGQMATVGHDALPEDFAYGFRDHRHDESFPAVPPATEGPLAPVSFLDDKGQQVLRPDGKPMERPAGMDPHFFVNQGIKDRKLEIEIETNSIIG